jgi:hypothetical protein
MPFDLGLTVMAAMNHPASHTWCVFESNAHRIQKSLSDLSGTDVYVHDGTIQGLFRELCNALVRVKRRPTVRQMKAVYQTLEEACPGVMAKAGTRSPWSASLRGPGCLRQ